MKAQTFSVLLALASGATATFKDSTPYHAPSNTYDQCISKQPPGYNWGDLPTGPVGGYGGFNFQGWSCQNSFGGGSKRNLAARTNGFQEKCITGHASSDKNNCPKISCGSGGPSSFTIDHVQVSVEFDCDLEFHYDMDDGSSCKTKHSCSTGGTTVKNSQCAGAKNVTVVLPNPPKAKPSCSIGFHSIGWNCPTASPSSSSPPKATSTPGCYGKHCGSSSTSSAPVATTTPGCYGKHCGGSSTSSTPAESSTTHDCYGKDCGGSSTSTTPAESSSSTPPAESSPSTSVCYGYKCGGSSTSTTPAESSSTTPGCYGSDCGGSSTSTTPAQSSSTTPGCYGSDCGGSSTSTIPSESPTTPGCYGSNCGGSTSTTPADSTSAYTPPSSSIPPVYTPPSGTPVYANSSTTYVPPSTAPNGSPTTAVYVPPTSVAPTSSAPYVPPTPAPCPPLLPSCMNTFLSISGCTDNTDKDCYCPKSDFTKLVFDCLYAHGADDSEIYAAQTYFQGICAQYVPQNPALITSCPVTPAASTYTIAGPVTTITYKTTLTLTGSTPGAPSTVSVYTSAATIPEVAFSTVTATGTSSVEVGLFTGTPAPVPAATTFASVTPAGTGSLTGTGSSPVFTGAAAPRSNAALGVVGAAMAFAVLAL